MIRSLTPQLLDMNSRQTILLVDDSEFDVLLMRAAFKKAQFQPLLQVVCNGEEAIAYLAGTAPYHDRVRYPLPMLVLLDINMPKKNGFEVLRWLRADPVLKRLSVTMLTASLRPEDVDLAFELGANSYLVKPSNLESLAEILRTLRAWVTINHFATVTPGNGVTIELAPVRMTTQLPPTKALRVGI